MPDHQLFGLGVVEVAVAGRQVGKLDGSAQDFLKNAEAYQRIIDANSGDYNKAAINNGPEVLSLVRKMQDDYLGLHMNGYETVEGISANNLASGT